MADFNKIDIQFLLKELRNQTDCIIKIDLKNSTYTDASDVDIFCSNLDLCVPKLLEMGKQYLEKGWEINVEIVGESHVQIRFYEGEINILTILFNLYEILPL